MTLYLLNTTVIPCGADGIWQASTLPLASAKMNVGPSKPAFISAVGHESTAAIMASLLGVEVPVNRIQVKPVVGDRMLCFKLKNRAPEGVILTEKEINDLGYEWVLMEYHGTIGAALDAKFAEHSAYLENLNQRVY